MTAVCFCFADDMDDLDCQTEALQGLPNQITPMCTPANENSSFAPAIQSGQTADLVFDVNTVRKLNGNVNMLQAWLVKRGENRPIQIIPPVLLNQCMATFINEMKKPNGSDYEPETCQSCFWGNNQAFAYCRLWVQLKEHITFNHCREVLEAKKKDLKEKGKGNKPKRSKAVEDDVEEKMWENKALGSATPEQLLHTVLFFCTKMLGQRGCDEGRQLQWGDIILKIDNDGHEYLEWNERLTKTRQGCGTHQRAFCPKMFPDLQNKNRCPVEMYKLYA